MRRRLASLEELGWVFRWADWVGSRGGGARVELVWVTWARECRGR